MGSSYFGEPNMGGGGGGGSSGRKSKKSSNNSEKPKQPQRGLGVAQLEKIRLHGQLGCNYHQYPPSLHSPKYPLNFNQEDVMRVQASYSSIPSSSFSYAASASASAASSPSYGFQPRIIIGGVGNCERAAIGYGDSQPNSTHSWIRGTDIYEHQHFTQPSMSATRPLSNPRVEDLQPKTSKKYRSDSNGNSQNSYSSEAQELDLELRLAL